MLIAKINLDFIRYWRRNNPWSNQKNTLENQKNRKDFHLKNLRLILMYYIWVFLQASRAHYRKLNWPKSSQLKNKYPSSLKAVVKSSSFLRKNYFIFKEFCLICIHLWEQIKWSHIKVITNRTIYAGPKRFRNWVENLQLQPYDWMVSRWNLPDRNLWSRNAYNLRCYDRTISLL